MVLHCAVAMSLPASSSAQSIDPEAKSLIIFGLRVYQTGAKPDQ